MSMRAFGLCTALDTAQAIVLHEADAVDEDRVLNFDQIPEDHKLKAILLSKGSQQ